MLQFFKNLFKKKSPATATPAAPVASPFTVANPEAFARIAIGSQSETVKVLQRKLKESGFFNLTVSGVFGPNTEKSVIHFQQTHIDKSGKPLEPDGIVGAKTWWALFNPSGAAQKQGIGDKAKAPADIIPDGIEGPRLQVLEQALLLYVAPTREVPDGSNTGGGVTKFHEWFGMKPAPWCAMSFCWIVFQALGRLTWSGGKQAHVATLWNQLKGQGMTKSAILPPRPGDGFVMIHKNGTGHMGIVVRVSEDGKNLDVFEGNSGNRFALRRRRVGAGDHVGYINFYNDAGKPLDYAVGLTGEAQDGTNETR